VSQKEEIAKIETEIQTLTARRAKIAENYAAFAGRITTQIEKILKDAEVYDVIRALEVGRDKRRVDDQAQADALGKQIAMLSQMLAERIEDKPETPE